MNKINYLLLLLLFVFSSCFLTPYEPETDGLPDDEGEITLVYDLFVDTGNPDLKGRRETNFLLNDNFYWGEHGYTLWAVESGVGENIFSEREVALSKTSGSSVAGYGLVICQRMRTGYGQTMLTVMINTAGNYAIGKVVGGNYIGLKNWTNTVHLRAGYGRPNELKIMYDKDEKEFTLIINENEVEKFKDETAPVHEGGRNGYIVVISPQDKFPQNPVEVTFWE